MKKLLVLILAVMLAAAACTPAPNKSPADTGGGILFSDNFTNPDSGWDRFQNETGVTDYSNVGYLIYIKPANMVKWANPRKTFPNNLHIEVDVKNVVGPDNNAFGIICRYQDTGNFYYFYVSSDGYAGIGKKVNGKYSIISTADGKLQKFDIINLGLASNHLRVDCIDTNLTLTVNKTPIATAVDSTFLKGGVGLIVRTYDEGGADILFNSFYVYKP
jgi:hypothetical protein